MKKFAAALLAASLLSSAAQAATALYRVDANVGTDYLAAALSDLGYTVTTTTGNLAAFTLADYDVVLYANQNSGVPGGDIAKLDSHITAGGKLIYTSWTSEYPSLGAVLSGSRNLGTLTVGPLFSAGLTNPLSVVNPGWGIFSQGLTAGSGTSAGLFENGNSGIVVGNGGNTIWNGFLTDTVDAKRLYVNQLNYLAGGAVPEPASWAMLIAGFGLVGAAMRRRSAAAIAA